MLESGAALPTITWTVISSRRRAYWLKTLHQWHWISSAICLLGMLLFAVTGLTLNNASHIESKAVVTTRHATLPQDALGQLAPGRKKAPLPDAVSRWLDRELDVSTTGKPAEWSADEIYLSLPRAAATPGCRSTWPAATSNTNAPTGAGSRT